MTKSPKYHFPKAEKVQVFEHVETYIETQHNHATDPEVREAVANLQTLLTQLQVQYPNVTTKTEALTIIDAEFTEIRQSPQHRLATLRQQLLNPERHTQAIKATLGEVAKHYLEGSLLAKVAIAYLDKMSEAPDYGA
ncbi:hypothetical protein C7271_11050 [filamentous cyanobacterium CCP5]|nr:hypothetical protein C7271_11050 [filamentous cyanobacterium CCP5]